MNDGKRYALDLANLICIFLLVALISTAVFSWFSSYDRSTAIANTGACIGMLLAVFSARGAETCFDRSLVISSLLASFGFQVWSLVAAVPVHP
jgi:hypothetical protein